MRVPISLALAMFGLSYGLWLFARRSSTLGWRRFPALGYILILRRRVNTPASSQSQALGALRHPDELSFDGRLAELELSLGSGVSGSDGLAVVLVSLGSLSETLGSDASVASICGVAWVCLITLIAWIDVEIPSGVSVGRGVITPSSTRNLEAQVCPTRLIRSCHIPASSASRFEF